MTKKMILWIARIIIIVIAVVYGLFATDSDSIIGFFISLLPSVFLLLLLLFTWKKPKAACIVFFNGFIMTTLFFHTYRNAAVFMIISLPVLIPSVLFVWVAWFSKQDV